MWGRKNDIELTIWGIRKVADAIEVIFGTKDNRKRCDCRWRLF